MAVWRCYVHSWCTQCPQKYNSGFRHPLQQLKKKFELFAFKGMHLQDTPTSDQNFQNAQLNKINC